MRHGEYFHCFLYIKYLISRKWLLMCPDRRVMIVSGGLLEIVGRDDIDEGVQAAQLVDQEDMAFRVDQGVQNRTEGSEHHLTLDFLFFRSRRLSLRIPRENGARCQQVEESV